MTPTDRPNIPRLFFGGLAAGLGPEWVERHVRNGHGPLGAAYPNYRGARDTWHGETSERATVFRWREAYQNSFSARLDWCVRPPREANHEPVAVIAGPAERTVAILFSTVGRSIRMEAARCASSRTPECAQSSPLPPPARLISC